MEQIVRRRKGRKRTPLSRMPAKQGHRITRSLSTPPDFLAAAPSIHAAAPSHPQARGSPRRRISVRVRSAHQHYWPSRIASAVIGLTLILISHTAEGSFGDRCLEQIYSSISGFLPEASVSDAKTAYEVREPPIGKGYGGVVYAGTLRPISPIRSSRLTLPGSPASPRWRSKSLVREKQIRSPSVLKRR